MPFFAIVAQADPPATSGVASRIKSFFGADAYREIAPNAWIVRSDMESKAISDAIFPRPDGRAEAKNIIMRIDAHWGWHDKSLWEWLSKKDS